MKKIMFAGLLGLLAGCATQPPTPQTLVAPVPQAAVATQVVAASKPVTVQGPQSYLIPGSKFDLAPDEVVTQIRSIGYQAYGEKKTVRVRASLADFNFIREHIQQISRSIPVMHAGVSKDVRIDLI